MDERPPVRSADTSAGPDPPSVVFQQLGAEFPDLPRRVVGEVLSRVYAAAGASSPELSPEQLYTAAHALLDAVRDRTAEAGHRTSRWNRRASPIVVAPDRDEPALEVDAEALRLALDPGPEVKVLSRAERVAAVVETRARVSGVPMSTSLLCQVAAAHLEVAAVAVSVPGGLLSAQTLGVAGAFARPLEELQVILDEGPSHDGLSYGAPVFVEDLAAPAEHARWPLYAPAATDQGVLAQFVLPMQVGAARFGVFVLYLDRVGGLGAERLGEARIFGEVALGLLIDHAAGGALGAEDEPRPRQPFLDDRAEIHQATGMVSVQLGADLATALLRLRARAFADHRLLSDLAADVVARSLRFRPDDDHDEHRFEETA